MNEEITKLSADEFINDFDDLYSNHREVIFRAFENDSFSTSDKQEIFAAQKRMK